MRKFLVALVISLFATGAFAKDIFIGVDPSETGQVTKFTKPLVDGDRVILSWAPKVAQATGWVGFANQGQFTTYGNNSNEVCMTFQGDGPVDALNHNPRTVCGLLSGSVQFSYVGGVSANKVYQATFVNKGDAPDGIRVKVVITPVQKPRTK